MEIEKVEEQPPSEQPLTISEVPPTTSEPSSNPNELTQEKKDTSKILSKLYL